MPSGYIVQFIVHKDGHLTDVTALTSHGFGIEQQAVRLISKGPDWIPAKQNGRNVNAYRKQPITFVIAQKVSITNMNDTGFPVHAYLFSPDEFPKINLADLKKVKKLSLIKVGSIESYELMGFRITIDPLNSENSSKDFVIRGSNFSDELLKILDSLDSAALITIEDIDVKINSSQKRLPPRIYKAIIINTTPG